MEASSSPADDGDVFFRLWMEKVAAFVQDSRNTSAMLREKYEEVLQALLRGNVAKGFLVSLHFHVEGLLSQLCLTNSCSMQQSEQEVHVHEKARISPKQILLRRLYHEGHQTWQQEILTTVPHEASPFRGFERAGPSMGLSNNSLTCLKHFQLFQECDIRDLTLQAILAWQKLTVDAIVPINVLYWRATCTASLIFTRVGSSMFCFLPLLV